MVATLLVALALPGLPPRLRPSATDGAQGTLDAAPAPELTPSPAPAATHASSRLWDWDWRSKTQKEGGMYYTIESPPPPSPPPPSCGSGLPSKKILIIAYGKPDSVLDDSAQLPGSTGERRVLQAFAHGACDGCGKRFAC